MKKILSLTIALFLSFGIYAQTRTIFVNESFSGIDFPEGWEFKGGGKNNWSISESSHAGGEANELKFDWTPKHYGMARIVTTAVDMTNVTEVYLSLKHFLNSNGNENTIGVATTSDDCATWNVAWSQAYSTTGSYVINETISTPDMGKENVRFCIFFDGESNSINGWYFDDFKVLTEDNYNINLLSIDVEESLNTGENAITFSIQNEGITTVSSFEARYEIEDVCSVTQTFDTSLETLKTGKYTFNTPAIIPPGEHKLIIEILSVNGNDDSYPNNNKLQKDLSVVMGLVDRKPLIEHFSSSTCTNCPAVNDAMLYLTYANKDKYTYVKYPLDFPGAGDPYYTEESAERMFGFYGNGGIPQIYCDARDMGTPLSQTDLNERYEDLSYVDIKGSFTMKGDNIVVTADFMSYKELKNVNAFVVVNEKTTVENYGTTDEVEFHHIMMKMLGGTEGTKISVKAGEYQRLEFTYDMTQTHVEDTEDLEVALWLQNLNNWEVYNSTFAYEYSAHPYPAENLKLTKNGDNIDITWDDPEVKPLAYNLYVNNKLVKANTTEKSYSHNNTSDFCIVKVETLYENMQSVSVVKVYSEEDSVEEENNITVNIYPNPADNTIFVEGCENINSINIYNVLGAKVYEKQTIENNNKNIIDITNLQNGIYFLNINTDKGNIVKKFIKK